MQTSKLNVTQIKSFFITIKLILNTVYLSAKCTCKKAKQCDPYPALIIAETDMHTEPCMFYFIIGLSKSKAVAQI